MSIRTSLTFSESASQAKQSQEQIKNMVDMNKVEREDDMQISRSAGENVLASAPSQHSRSAGENVLASSPSQQDAKGVPVVFSFKKLRADESSRASETTTPPRVGPNTPSPDTFFTPEMEAKKDPLAGGMLQDMIMRLESAMGMTMENLKGLRENQHALRENQNVLIQTQNTLIAMQQ
jgi:hypothetical protein